MTQRSSSALILSLLAAVSAGAGAAGTPEPVGDEFQVNTYTTSEQYSAAVAALADGGFVVAWTSVGSSGTDSSLASVQGQRFDPAGGPVGGEFQVNTYTMSYQSYPAVAADAGGAFVVVWNSYGSGGTDSSFWSIQGRRFDSAGAPLGDDFQINTYTTDFQSDPAVAADGDGNFVVVWHSFGSDSDASRTSIQGQRYDSAGAPVGGQFQVNTYVTGYQLFPAVAAEAGGDFVVVWSSGVELSAYSIRGQRFDSAGAPVGGEFQVNTYVTNYQTEPAVAVDAGGGFVVAWQSVGSGGSDSSSWSIQGRRFDASGTPLGDQFQVNVYTTSSQVAPAVAVDGDGDFVVAWQSIGSGGSDSSSWSIQGRRFDASGTPAGDEFQVNTYVTSYQSEPSVAAGVDGDFVVAWESDGSNGSDSSGRSVQGQRFAGPIFADGFESGDLSSWSAPGF